MSWGGKILAAILLVAASVVGVLGYIEHRDQVAEQRGVDQQVARDIAKTNQTIPTRRETDALCDSRDAHALCADFDLEWVFEDGKSFSR